MHLASRWLGPVAVGTATILVLCAGFAWLLFLPIDIHWAAQTPGTARGGISEIAMTTKVLQLGVPLVTALHITPPCCWQDRNKCNLARLNSAKPRPERL